jgi:hypothetical protein
VKVTAAAEFNAVPIENGDDFLWGNIFLQRKKASKALLQRHWHRPNVALQEEIENWGVESKMLRSSAPVADDLLHTNRLHCRHSFRCFQCG